MEPVIKVNRNHFIQAPRLFVINESGEPLGELSRDEALRMAMESELDLIEISPKANPPVAKIMSWSKYKYILEKKKKEQKKNKSAEQKEMRFKVFIEEGDLQHKLKKVEEFLQKKHSVKLQIRAVGRSKDEHLRNLMTHIIEELKEKCLTDGIAKKEGRNLSIIVKPKK